MALTGFPATVDLALRVNKLGKSSVTYEIGVFERGIAEPRAVEDLEKPHTLSTMLYRWKHDRVSCYSQDRTTADMTVPGTCLRR